MSPSQSRKAKSNIRRRRTGCLTCRERRVRCGEEKPDCKNCCRKSRTCVWAKDGDRFLHHPLSLGSITVTDDKNCPSLTEGAKSVADISSNESPPWTNLSTMSSRSSESYIPLATPTVSTMSATTDSNSILPDSWHMDPQYPTQPTHSSSRRSSDNLSSVASAEELACWRSEVLQAYSGDNRSANNNFARSMCRSQSARLKDHIDQEHESLIPPNLEPNAEVFSDWETLGASEVVVKALSGSKEIKLLQTYLRECAHWFDAFDSHRHYGKKSVTRMMTCPPWRAAALAISAKHMETHDEMLQSGEPLSLHLYQLAVQLAIDSISGRFDCVGTTAGCVVLAVYEMMTVAYQDWRRHLRGCTSIYSHNHWNGDSVGLIGASFWNYARIDIWAAFCVGTSTMLGTDSWFSSSERALRSTNLDEDRHAHLVTWLLARVNNLIHSSTDCLDSPGNDSHFQLRNDLERWKTMGSNITKPIMQRDADQYSDNPFPSTLFAGEGSAVAHILWYTALVLLLEFEKSKQSAIKENMSQNIYEYARTACGIVETHDNARCVLIDAIHPLWICGRHLRLRSEKFAVLELLAKIERETGWKTRWRADSLREMWKLG